MIKKLPKESSARPSGGNPHAGGRGRIGPLIEDSPELAKLVAPARQKDSGNTVLAKSFPGRILVMTGANSAVGLRSMPARYLFLTLSRPTDEELTAGEGYPPGYVHVPSHMDAEWCRQLVAEHRVRSKSGRFEWKKNHQANEALDCRVYSRAALWTMGVAGWRAEHWRRIRTQRQLDETAAVIASPPPPLPASQRARRSDWLGGGRDWLKR